MHLPDFLIDRYKDWKNNIFSKKEDLFKILQNKGQMPKAMIISCCDSRVNPNSIFKATEGDFFIHRNVANLIPSLDAKKVNYETLAAIEFATKTLNISDIIVLGHSCCGGIDYAHKVFFEQIADNNSFLFEWIQIIKPAFKKLNENDNKETRIRKLEKLSILNSIENLKNFPEINNLILKNKLKIHGMWIDISSGNLMNYNDKNKKFENII